VLKILCYLLKILVLNILGILLQTNYTQVKFFQTEVPLKHFLATINAVLRLHMIDLHLSILIRHIQSTLTCFLS